MVTKLNEFNKEATLDVYNQRRNKYTNVSNRGNIKNNPYRVYWETGQICQERRFENLLKIGIKNKDTVLDFGCGLGDLYRYAKNKGLDIKYIGVDINKNFIDDAKYQFGIHLKHLLPFDKKIQPKFYAIDTIDDVNEDFDWFLASGVFTYSFEIEDILEILEKAYKKCKKGIAFNVLSIGNYNDEKKIIKFSLGSDSLRRFNTVHLLTLLKQRFDNVDSYFEYDDYVFYIRK